MAHKLLPIIHRKQDHFLWFFRGKSGSKRPFKQVLKHWVLLCAGFETSKRTFALLELLPTLLYFFFGLSSSNWFEFFFCNGIQSGEFGNVKYGCGSHYSSYILVISFSCTSTWRHIYMFLSSKFLPTHNTLLNILDDMTYSIKYDMLKYISNQFSFFPFL